jgi:hypothetical protein
VGQVNHQHPLAYLSQPAGFTVVVVLLPFGCENFSHEQSCGFEWVGVAARASKAGIASLMPEADERTACRL